MISANNKLKENTMKYSMIENRIEEIKYKIRTTEIYKAQIETFKDMIANGELTKEKDPDVIRYYNEWKEFDFNSILNKYRKELKELEIMLKQERLNEDFKFEQEIY